MFHRSCKSFQYFIIRVIKSEIEKIKECWQWQRWAYSCTGRGFDDTWTLNCHRVLAYSISRNNIR